MRNVLYLGALLAISFGCSVALGILDHDSRGLASLFRLENLSGFAIYTLAFFVLLISLHRLDRRRERAKLLGGLALLAASIATFLVAFADRVTFSTIAILFLLGGTAAGFLWAAQRVPALLLGVDGLRSRSPESWSPR